MKNAKVKNTEVIYFFLVSLSKDIFVLFLTLTFQL